MNMQMLERAKRQWQFVADAMPQLICLVDGAGRVLHTNRTLERWGLGRIDRVGGVDLHALMHKHCIDTACYLRAFWQHAAMAPAGDPRAACDAWDPVLRKHLRIRIYLPLPRTEHTAKAEDLLHFFAVVVVEDMTASKARENENRQAARMLKLRAEREERKRTQAEKAQLHLFTLLDKAPLLTAMADRSGALFYVNPAGRALLGLGAEEELSGLTLIACQAPSARACIAEDAMPAAERDGLWSGDSVLYSRDGREIRSHLTLVADRDGEGRLEGYSLLARDMSDWVRTEEALRATQNELWRLSAQHLTIQESERRRIAVDLHDGLGQTLSLVKLSIEEAARSLGGGTSGKVAAALERLGPTVKSALTELRRISMNLRPSTLDDLGILATLSWYFREFEAACPNVRLERDISAAEADVPDFLKISIFRIVQEATSNALKHAGAQCIKVCLRERNGSLELSIEDDGRGFDAAAGVSDFNHGLGLQSMQERAGLSGGDYELKSAPGEGTRIRVRWRVEELSQRTPAESFELSRVQVLRQPGPPDHHLLERLSQCFACMKTLGSK